MKRRLGQKLRLIIVMTGLEFRDKRSKIYYECSTFP